MHCLLFWGLEFFQETVPQSTTFFQNHEIVDARPELSDESGVDAYVFEVYPFPPTVLGAFGDSGIAQFSHPNLGIVTMKLLLGNEKCPGIFAVLCRRTKVPTANPHGLTYGGGVTSVGVDGYHEQINVIYLLDEYWSEFLKNKRIKNLDLSTSFRLMC